MRTLSGVLDPSRGAQRCRAGAAARPARGPREAVALATSPVPLATTGPGPAFSRSGRSRAKGAPRELDTPPRPASGPESPPRSRLGTRSVVAVRGPEWAPAGGHQQSCLAAQTPLPGALRPARERVRRPRRVVATGLRTSRQMEGGARGKGLGPGGGSGPWDWDRTGGEGPGTARGGPGAGASGGGAGDEGRVKSQGERRRGGAVSPSPSELSKTAVGDGGLP